MKRITRILGVFLCLVMAFSGNAYAATSTTIDTSNSSDGYFSVYYPNTNVRMKVGVQHGGTTEYYDYLPGSLATYSFTEGDGSYRITLYRNISGTSYSPVTSSYASVKLESEVAPYLISTTEVTFSESDAVGQKAAELCAGITDDASKVVAIHNYIAKNFKYNYVLAVAVRNGSVKNYIPDTNNILANQRGICYDFTALFAAMCRSQGIPCAVAKGYTDNNVYHAWNMIYLEDTWVAVDMTASIFHRLIWADELSDCVVSLDSYYNYTF